MADGILKVGTITTSSGSGTITVPSGVTTTLTDGISGDLKFNSGFGSVATAYGCRAWVNFDGTGTVAIRDSGNVSSITDNGTGNYTVNFTTNMPDANYAWNIGIGRTGAQSGGAVAFTSTAPSAGALRVLRFKENFTSHDEEFMCVTIFR